MWREYMYSTVQYIQEHMQDMIIANVSRSA
jgi:hypothetical protein